MHFIFLSYINRSGSTYLANLLSKSEEICVCPEAEILYNLLLIEPLAIITTKQSKKYNRILSTDKKFELWKISNIQLIKEGKNGFDNFLDILNTFRKTHYPQASIILFKHNYLLNLRSLVESKNYTWINLIRDPRSAYASQRNTISPFTGKLMSRNVLEFCDSWNKFMQEVINWQKPENVLTIKYEDLVLTGTSKMHEICSKIPLQNNWESFKERPSQLINLISQEYRKIHVHIEEEPNSESLFKWKTQLRNPELAILMNNIVRTQFYPEIGEIERHEYYLPYLFFLRAKRKFTHLRAKAYNYYRNISAP